MKLPRRQFLHLAAGAAALPAVLRIARAQAYPAQPVRIIVGFPAAGGTDITARLMGQWLSERLCWRRRLPVALLTCRNAIRSDVEHAACSAIGQETRASLR